MTPAQKNFLKEFYQSLTDKPLEWGDKHYVPFHQRLPKDPIEVLKSALDWETSESVNLLLGQIGNGKSTELRRLQGMLEASGYVVFLCDMEGYINPSEPLEVGDFLISVMGAMTEAMDERYDIKLGPDYWHRMTQFLQQEVKIEHISMGSSTFNLKASLNRNADFKDAVRLNLRKHTNQVTNQAWLYASQMVDLVRKKTGSPDKQVVLLVDSLEKQRGFGREKTVAVYDSMQRLFTADARSLRIPKLHMVYSIPPYLPALTPNVGNSLDGATLIRLPSVHVLHQDDSEDDSGLSVMNEIIDKRFPAWRSVFSVEQMRDLAKASGGDFRAFFRLIKRCLTIGATRGNLPLQDDVIRMACLDYKSEFLPIAKDDARWLLRIASNHRVELDQHDQLSTLARFFDGKLVLNYRNGEDWYDVHPLLKQEIKEILGVTEGG